MALVLALRTSATEVSAALVTSVRRRDDIVVLCRVGKAADVPLVNSVVRVCSAPVNANDILCLALAVGNLTGLTVLRNLKTAADPTTTTDAGGPAKASAYLTISTCSRTLSRENWTCLRLLFVRSRILHCRCSRCCR
jgi:hypothetical protein